MKANMTLIGLSLMLGVFIVACGGGQPPTKRPVGAAYLPERLTAIDWERAPEVRAFVGDSLYEYIDGGAELYHTYGFVDVTVGDYTGGSGEIVADLYRFVGPEMAYGLFTTLRPEEPEFVPLGVEGFSMGPTLVFVKGDYVVNIIGYDESAATITAVRTIAEAIDPLLPGVSTKPAAFSLFPHPALIEHTEKMFASSFLGRKYLSNVYTVDCIQEADTMTLFLTEDDSGGAFARWSEQTTDDRTSTMSTDGLPYDGGNSFIIVDGYYGHIVAGLKGGKLLGIVGYNYIHAEFLSAWLNTLQ